MGVLRRVHCDLGWLDLRLDLALVELEVELVDERAQTREGRGHIFERGVRLALLALHRWTTLKYLRRSSLLLLRDELAEDFWEHDPACIFSASDLGGH